ncbi:hypothetical protein NDQ71_05775 [Pseudoalteromonas sp. KG3]|uniref:Uncharacterized protein n=1 Tax=Pseudoalteromonas prydzensis TaxID=182141 RepID=A0ABR9FPI3_9GAMM|nr:MULTISPECIES: hypothetical protein [Pseudoalteromonas]MBE0458737.1 hypothetical protein [Pseudoalteromonas prydzensis]WKD24578.1 hypothetical protein NDQ71_05775 [Pseudoalteromonas sp. KG3]|eukprot:TRINITY_DN361_c0_g5_i1.p1 TRINITY_DN361_c0_g5~~TRINITY_DN361_c0_g5_i1.p1  ORF type:complete len:105 (-),score=14.02 TRINITY_DN361_c0_g5_i1:462-776(-)
MRYILVLVFLFITSGKALAEQSVTIFVKETSYSINTSDEKLNSAELESKLKQLKFSLVTLDVDYCAGPVMVAEVYVAIANANPSVKDVHLKASGSHEQSKCKFV